ncbi:MAG TPA: S8 family peptidase [Aequorivita sp.]|nr:S8 family peptidase [Aequorivita sp.]
MKNLYILIFLLFSTIGFSQTHEALVFFTDKENVQASIANPIAILTQAAIDRKFNQGIAIDERDVPLNETYKATVSNSPGITVLAKSKWMNAVYVQGTQTQIENLNDLSFVSEVEYMDSSLNANFQKAFPTDKFEIETSERVVYNYGAAENQTQMINADYLHEQGYTGEGIIVAFMDNGYPNVLTNPAYATLRDEGRLLGYYDFVDRVEDPTGTGTHGTHTLSNAAAILDQQFVGTGPQASYYLFVTEDGRQESPVEEAYWVEALERADSLGVYVTNTSLGYQAFDNPNYDYQYSDLDGQTTIGARGASHGYDKGLINVTSAGNSGANFGYVGSPGDSPGTFTVGAVDDNENYASFSSYGPTYDGRVKPDVMAQGRSAAIVDYNGAVTTSNGTSFSSPIIAGAVASLWQAFPHRSNEVIMQVIRESSSLYNSPTDEMGYGIPDFNEALNMLIQLDIDDFKKEMLFALYPNPVVDKINVSFPNEIEKAQFTLYNALGKKVLQQTVTALKNQIDVSNLTSGMYIATLTSNNKTTSFKIIKE